MSTTRPEKQSKEYGPQKLVVELTNVCNLKCGYCVRDEDALYHTRASHFPVELLRRVLREARESVGVTHVSFTGGEPALHPRFKEVIEACAEAGVKASFVTNGWHFERVWPVLDANRGTVTHVSFSLDGATREAHDRWRGEGSFVRLVRAFARCHASAFPFGVKVALRRDTVPQLEQMAMFAARMGAASLVFQHLLPTSDGYEQELALSPDDRTRAEQEVALLARVFRMSITLAVGYANTDPDPPCAELAGRSCNIDYLGRLTLCCNLSGYRGAAASRDVLADLNLEDFATGFERIRRAALEQAERRRAALASLAASGERADLYTASPCLFCLQSFEKIPWRGAAPSRQLPVVQANA
jgi:MoaA/NifB/PqqE/SkfB family radical SAM enzyme